MFAVCDIPVSQLNGGYTLSLDRMSITYYCEPGFTLKGNLLRHCQLNNMGWDGADPTCGECECFKIHIYRKKNILIACILVISNHVVVAI